MALAAGGDLRRSGSDIDATAASVIADPGVVDVIRDGLRINVMHVRADIGYRAIVVEPSAIPIPAIVPAAGIAEAVVDAPVIANVLAPVAGVKPIMAIVEIPVRRGPKSADIGSHDPRAGHPVITGVGVAPVTRRPHIVISGRGRLTVIG
jgi:hypothetical protein